MSSQVTLPDPPERDRVDFKVDFHYRIEAKLFPGWYRGKANRRNAAMAYFDGVIMRGVRTKALESYMRGIQEAGVEL